MTTACQAWAAAPSRRCAALRDPYRPAFSLTAALRSDDGFGVACLATLPRAKTVAVVFTPRPGSALPTDAGRPLVWAVIPCEINGMSLGENR